MRQGKERRRLDPRNCSWTGFLLGRVADNRAVGWMDSSELRTRDRVALQVENFTADPKIRFLFSLFKLHWTLSTLHSFITSTRHLSACRCSQSLSLLNLFFCFFFFFPRPSPYSPFPTVAHLGFGFLTLANFDFSVNLILSSVSPEIPQFFFF